MTFKHAPLDYIGDGKWRVREDYTYQSRYGNVTVEKDFVSDLASVPPLPLAYTLTKNASVTGAVVHDWLYREGTILGQRITRQQADNVMFDVMVDEGISWWRRRLIITGLKIGGWLAWNKHRDRDEMFI